MARTRSVNNKADRSEVRRPDTTGLSERTFDHEHVGKIERFIGITLSSMNIYFLAYSL
jgi:hypothetical protein